MKNIFFWVVWLWISERARSFEGSVLRFSLAYLIIYPEDGTIHLYNPDN
jgi:hypothetical protein